MRKLNYFLGMLLLSIATWVNAQETEPTVWDGSSLSVTLNAGEARTYSYTAEEEGILYIYSSSQNAIPVSISGGYWLDGNYDENFPLEDTGTYDNGFGVYGHIKVWEGDQIRFTLAADEVSEDAEAKSTSLSLESLFFSATEWKANPVYWKGESWESTVELTMGKTVTVPVFTNTSTEVISGYDKLTFCSFTAPSDGTASVKTTVYEILYQEEDLVGAEAFKKVIEGSTQYMHDFAVEKGKKYIIALPNDRPNGITVSMASNRRGATCADPIEITDGQTSYNLAKGNNWFQLDVSSLGTKQILDLGVTEGWSGTITYWMNCLNEQEGLGSNSTSGQAAVFHKNISPELTGNDDYLYINVYLNNQEQVENGVSFTLREPQEGETCATAIIAEAGVNELKGDARDYWFSYTPTKDCNISLKSTDLILYYLPSCGSSNHVDLNGVHQYRVYADQTVYIGVRKNVAEDGTLTIEESDIVPGVNCDYPIDFTLGEDVTIKDRTTETAILATTYLRFTAEKSGFAIIETTCDNWVSTYWTANFRTTCYGTVLPLDREEYEDSQSGKLGLRYKVAVSAGVTYIFDLTNDNNNGEDITASTRFEEAAEEGGTTCETAIPILTEQLGTDIAIPGESDLTIWYTYTPDKSGYFNVKGCARGTKQYRIGECSAMAKSFPTDYGDDGMGYQKGLFSGKFYVEAGTPVFFNIKTNNTPLDDENPFYLNVTFSEPLPGETFGTAIKAEADVAYEIAKGSYETWYYYTIPAGREQVIELGSENPIYFNKLYFYQGSEDNELSSYSGDYTEEQIKNESNQIISRKYTFPTQADARTIHFVTPDAPTVEGLTFTIIGEGTGIESVKAATTTLTIAPNPNDGAFSISVPAVAEGAYVSVCSMSGAEVYRAPLTNTVTNVDLSGRLSAGMYVVTVRNGGTATAKMLVK